MADLDDVSEVLAHPDVFWWVSPPITRRWARDWLAEEIGLVERDGGGRHAVVLKETGRVIGGCGLVRRALEWGPETELGYHLAREQWGRGYATEAARACLGHARTAGLRRIVSLIYIDNPRSVAVARRLDMSLERELVWAGLPHGLWVADLARSR